MTTRTGRLILGLLAFALLFLIACAFAIPRIENDLTHSVEDQLTAAGITGVSVSFDGRDGTMEGPPSQKDAALAAVTDRWGIASLEYQSTGAEVVIPSTTTEAPTSTEATTTTSATTTSATTTTVAPTSTAATSTAAPTTTAPAVQVDATVGIDQSTITLSGFVASNAQKQALLDAANNTFLPQGTVVDQVQVKAAPASGDANNAVRGLAAFITAAEPSMLSGQGHLQNTSFQVQGQGFNKAATDSLNRALAAQGQQFGVTVEGTVTDGLTGPNELQPSLNALVGRSGVNFDSGSATITPDSQVVLNSAAASMLQEPAPIEILGYTDNQGDPQSNLDLSQQRADAVKTYLVGRGVPADSLTATGKGEADPIADNTTPEGRAKNRRIEFQVQG